VAPATHQYASQQRGAMPHGAKRLGMGAVGG
jgi:hypothetical protein